VIDALRQEADLPARRALWIPALAEDLVHAGMLRSDDPICEPLLAFALGPVPQPEDASDTQAFLERGRWRVARRVCMAMPSLTDAHIAALIKHADDEDEIDPLLQREETLSLEIWRALLTAFPRYGVIHRAADISAVRQDPACRAILLKEAFPSYRSCDVSLCKHLAMEAEPEEWNRLFQAVCDAYATAGAEIIEVAPAACLRALDPSEVEALFFHDNSAIRQAAVLRAGDFPSTASPTTDADSSTDPGSDDTPPRPNGRARRGRARPRAPKSA
jgi:hypothetical protein